ncbi:MAG: PhoPQ-activated pathogenicity-related family protein [Candidatus Hydrogenedentes bacterium]|nr:PhoPQ-activated pathogenicity-related family protein [Candidatus Hydrogenedentota bacterium]
MRRFALAGMLALFAVSHAAFAGPLGNTAREAARPTSLDTYAHAEDGAFAYKLESTVEDNGFKMYVIDLTSQKWRTEGEVSLSVWKHWMTIYVPPVVESATALLFIGGGDNGDPAPGKMDANFAYVAGTAKSVVAELGMVPNQPITFPEEGKPREEDEFITKTWDKFLRTGDPLWPARLPMTKSAVRAMDAIQLFLGSDEGGKVAVDNFVVAGGSKRGWTTWTTAAVDRRVVAITPFVIDMLNMVPSFMHHWNVYGFWAPAVGDYVEMGLMDWMGTPEYDKLLEIEEPYSYLDRFTMPKYIVNSVGDQFFLPDSSQFYWNDLPGKKYLRYIPNTDHGLDGSDAYQSMTAFFHAVVTATPLPEYDWQFMADGSIRVTTNTAPIAVKLWQAANPDARDFRKESIGEGWTSTDLTAGADGAYVGTVAKPEKGWAAYLVELTFASAGDATFKVTSSVRIAPDTLEHTYTFPEKRPVGYLSQY